MNPQVETIRTTLTHASRRWTNRLRLKRLAYGIWGLAFGLFGVYLLCFFWVVPHEILRMVIVLGLIEVVGIAFWISLAPRCSLTQMALRYEKHFPRFKGRLNLTVEILTQSNPQEPWPDFAIHALNRSAHHLTRYPVVAVLPLQKPLRMLLTGIGLLVVMVGLYTLGPNPRPLQQLTSAWETRGGRGFKFVLSQPQVSVIRGRPFTLTAYLVPISSSYQIPENVFLVLRSPESNLRYSMKLEQGTWRVEIPYLEVSCDYWVEGNRVRSSSGSITVVDSLELVDTQIRVAPPSYVERSTQTYGDFSSLTVIQGGEIHFQFTWNDSPRAAELYFESDQNEEPVLLPLVLNRKGVGQGNYRPTSSGTYRLRAIAQSGIPFEWSTHVLTVLPDRLPEWSNLRGFPTKNRRAKPTDRLWIRGTIVDDLGLHDVYLEWRLNDGPVRKISLADLESGMTQTHIDHIFSLENRGRIGDRLYLRLVASDGRPIARTERARAWYPFQGWLEILLDESSSSLNEQDVLANEIEIPAQLREIQKILLEQLQHSESLIQFLKRNPLYLHDHPERVRALNENFEDLFDSIRKLQRMIDPIFGYTTIRVRLQSLQENLGKLRHDFQPLVNEPEREDSLDFLNELTQKLTRTNKILDTLRLENQRICQTRLLMAKLENLGLMAGRFASQTKTASLTPADREAWQTLWNGIWKDPNLKETIRLTKESQLHTLGQSLAELHCEFLQTDEDLQKAIRNQKVHFFQGVQSAFNQQVLNGLKQTERFAFMARILRQSPPESEFLNDSYKEFLNGNSHTSLQHLDRVLVSLGRFNQALRASLDAIDEPRERGQFLLRLQEEILSELNNQTQQKEWKDLPLIVKGQLIDSQTNVTDIQKELQLQIEKSVAACEHLQTGELAQARRGIEENLAYLKANIPTLATNEQRRLRLQQELAQLRKELESYRKSLDVLKRDCSKDNPDDFFVRLQHRQLLSGLKTRALLQAEKLQSLSIPIKNRPRFEKLDQAWQKFCNDLSDGLYFDCLKSLALVRRELDAYDMEQDQLKAIDTELDELATKLADLIDKQKTAPLDKITDLLADYQRISQGWLISDKGASLWYFQERLAQAQRELQANPKEQTSLNQAAQTLRLIADLMQDRVSQPIYIAHLSKILSTIDEGNARKFVPKFIEEWKLLRVGIDRYSLWKRVADQAEGWLKGNEKWNPTWIEDMKKLANSYEPYEPIRIDPEEALCLFAQIMPQATAKDGPLLTALVNSFPVKEPLRTRLRETCLKLSESEKNPDPASGKLARDNLSQFYEQTFDEWRIVVERARPRLGVPNLATLHQLNQLTQEILTLKQKVSAAHENWLRDRACQKWEAGPSETQRPILEALQRMESVAEKIASISQGLLLIDLELSEQTKGISDPIRRLRQAILDSQEAQTEILRLEMFKQWTELKNRFPQNDPPAPSPVGESLWRLYQQLAALERSHAEKNSGKLSLLWREVEKLAYRSSSLLGSTGE